MGIWLIYYGIDDANRNNYLDWFEDQHIQEKLDRPGYDWAAHYLVTGGGSSDHGDNAYLALFGAKSSRVFFDPSPAQIKPHQDDLTREMIGYRIGAISLILTEEWTQNGAAISFSTSANHGAQVQPVDSELVRLSLFHDDADEQAISAWCAQKHFPAVAASGNNVCVRKWLASAGSPRHSVLEEYNPSIAPSTTTANVAENLIPFPEKHLTSTPAVAARRIFKQSEQN